MGDRALKRGLRGVPRVSANSSMCAVRSDRQRPKGEDVYDMRYVMTASMPPDRFVYSGPYLSKSSVPLTYDYVGAGNLYYVKFPDDYEQFDLAMQVAKYIAKALDLPPQVRNRVYSIARTVSDRWWSRYSIMDVAGNPSVALHLSSGSYYDVVLLRLYSSLVRKDYAYISGDRVVFVNPGNGKKLSFRIRALGGD